MYEGQDTKASRGIFSGFFVIVIATILLIAGASVYFYGRCTSQFWGTDWEAEWLYPGATIVSETSQFFSTQQRIFLSPDDQTTVDAWYREKNARVSREAVETGDFSLLNTKRDFRLVPDANGNGTRIVFTGTCP